MQELKNIYNQKRKRFNNKKQGWFSPNHMITNKENWFDYKLKLKDGSHFSLSGEKAKQLGKTGSMKRLKPNNWYKLGLSLKNYINKLK